MKSMIEPLNQKLRLKAKAKIKFRANLFFASEGAIKHVPLITLKKKVDAFKQAGVSGIDINVGLFPWLENDTETVKKYDELLAYIKEQGLELALDPFYTPVFHRVKSFDDWKIKAQKVWLELARRYKPDILILIHEPTTQATRMGFKVSPENWAGFVQEMAIAVKNISPDIKLGAGVWPTEYEYFKLFVRIPELTYITFDVYALRYLKQVNRMIPEAKKAGKKVYIEETWRPPYFTGNIESMDKLMSESIGNEKFQEIDRLWLELITLYASVWEMESVTAFYTQPFFTYVDTHPGDNALDPSYNSQVISAINNNQRTDTFYMFQKLIKEFGRAR